MLVRYIIILKPNKTRDRKRMSAVADRDFLPHAVKKYRPNELGKNVESQ